MRVSVADPWLRAPSTGVGTSPLSGALSYFHCTVGIGSPSPVHSKDTLWPITAKTFLLGEITILGGPKIKKINIPLRLVFRKGYSGENINAFSTKLFYTSQNTINFYFYLQNNICYLS